ncbi:MAG TPA: methyltransferase type 11 [Mycobacterium sp.]
MTAEPSTDTSAASDKKLSTTIRQWFVESPTSIGGSARRRRWEVVQRNFPELPDMRVVDLGGTVETWRRAPVRPREVTVVNLFEPGDSDDPRLIPVKGDACTARDTLVSAACATEFDLAFSNSLIEHVGGHARRLALSREIRSLAPYHWVQTPYRYFPIEPHWLFPLMQFLPMYLRANVALRWPLSHSKPNSWEDAREDVVWTELVSQTEMRMYFPESVLFKERLAGLVKSITAIRAPGCGSTS